MFIGMYYKEYIFSIDKSVLLLLLLVAVIVANSGSHHNTVKMICSFNTLKVFYSIEFMNETSHVANKIFFVTKFMISESHECLMQTSRPITRYNSQYSSL